MSLVRQALESAIEVLGVASKESILEDLENQDIDLNDPNLDLARLAKAIENIVGKDASELILERFRRSLADLKRHSE